MRFSRMSRYSCRHSHLSDLHQWFPTRFSAQTTLPYCVAIPQDCPARGFGGRLQPRYIIRAAAFDQ
jgi:hypothetical protein